MGIMTDVADAEPKWRFRFNDAMRNALYHACDLEDKKSELIVEKQCVFPLLPFSSSSSL